MRNLLRSLVVVLLVGVAAQRSALAEDKNPIASTLDALKVQEKQRLQLQKLIREQAKIAEKRKQAKKAKKPGAVVTTEVAAVPRLEPKADAAPPNHQSATASDFARVGAGRPAIDAYFAGRAGPEMMQFRQAVDLMIVELEKPVRKDNVAAA